MPRGRHFFGRGFWKPGYYGYPFIGSGRGRGRGFYGPTIPFRMGHWASPFVPHYPPAQPLIYPGGYFTPFYSHYGARPPVLPYWY